MTKTSLYRHFDADGRLLYVGISKNALCRLGGHTKKPWYGQIASVTIEHHKSRAHALYAEALAIRDEAPQFNVDMPAPCDPDAPPAPSAPASVRLGVWPRRMGYIHAERRYVGPHSIALDFAHVPREYRYIDVIDEGGENQPELGRLLKTAQHKGTEVYYIYSPDIGPDARRILSDRGVKVLCAS